MTEGYRSSADVVIRTEQWDAAVAYYRSILGLRVTQASDGFMGFDTGAFRLYVERGRAHGPVFELLVPDVQAAKDRLLAAGCTIFEENPALPNCYMRDPYGVTYNIALAPGAE